MYHLPYHVMIFNIFEKILECICLLYIFSSLCIFGKGVEALS